MWQVFQETKQYANNKEKSLAQVLHKSEQMNDQLAV
jgi:hypothetical protein